MITSIEIDGFRSLRHAGIDLRQLNVFIGSNQSGKTNFLDALDLLKQAALGHLHSALNQTRGGLANLLWAGYGTREMRFKVEIRVESSNARPAINLLYSFEIEDLFTRYLINREQLEELSDKESKTLYRFPSFVLNRLTEKPEDFDPSEMNLEELGITQFGIGIGGSYHYPDMRDIRDELSSISIYPGFDTKTRWASNHPTDTPQIRQPQFVTNSSELDPLGDNLVNVLYTLSQDEDRWTEFKEMVQTGFPDFENIVFPADAGQGRIALAWVDRRFPKKRFSAEVLSVGTLCFLAWAAALAAPESPTLIAIDEPEQHLHPELLYRLVGLLEQASSKHQIIVTTHSDALLSYLSDPTCVVLVNNGPEGTTLTRPPEADLREWLKAYSLGQLRESGHLTAFAPTES